MNPPRIEDVQAVCLAGETMPEKSTYFYPKLLDRAGVPSAGGRRRALSEARDGTGRV